MKVCRYLIPWLMPLMVVILIRCSPAAQEQHDTVSCPQSEVVRHDSLTYMDTVLAALRGTVYDCQQHPLAQATVELVARDSVHQLATDSVGHYGALLQPGDYRVQYWATGYDTVQLGLLPLASGQVRQVEVQLARLPAESN